MGFNFGSFDHAINLIGQVRDEFTANQALKILCKILLVAKMLLVNFKLQAKPIVTHISSHVPALSIPNACKCLRANPPPQILILRHFQQTTIHSPSLSEGNHREPIDALSQSDSAAWVYSQTEI